jgi:hypothetical protein
MGFTHVFKLNLHRGRVFYELGTHVLEIEPRTQICKLAFFASFSIESLGSKFSRTRRVGARE